MKKNCFIFIFVFCIQTLFAGPGVTYEFSGGRFGDNLLAYLHAKWVAYTHQIPLIYAPFPYSSELLLDEKEMIAYPAFETSVKMHDFSQPFGVQSSTLFICPWFSEIEAGMQNNEAFHFDIGWKDKKFRQIARELISPKHPLSLITPPKDRISIALHVREGGGFDTGNYFHQLALKMPPMTFYVECLLKILELLKGKSFYCHVFTDARNPQGIIEQIQQCMPPDAQIAFNYRKNDNYHNANVLEDFFSLFHFDILIRPQSHFSIVPSVLQDYAVMCSPLSFSIVDNIVKIEEIRVAIDEELYKKCLEK